MKKRYIKPEIETVEVSTEQMIAMSDPVYPDEVTGVEGQSKQYDFDLWEMDEEE